MLFDSGGMLSFISLSHAKFFNHKIEPSKSEFLISTPLGKVFIVESVCRDCEVKIENVAMKVHLILFELDELDMILGMDFLTKYYVVLDCSNKKVVLRESLKF